MAKGFQGMGGGMGGGNMNNLLKQAQKMQKDIENATKELETKEYETTVGGGACSVKGNGKKELTEIKFMPEAVDPEDVEGLEDLVLAAVNNLFAMVDEDKEKVMGKLTGGMPGLF